MKKLPILVFFSLFFSIAMEAQENSLVNSLSVLAGPSNFYQFPGKIIGGASHNSDGGYIVGVDVAHRLHKQWNFKLGFRYNVWQTVTKTGPLMWPSEYVNGQYVYDPSLPHYQESKDSDKAWQVLAGLGWQTKPKRWRWNTAVELGATAFTKETTGSTKFSTRLTTGISTGPEWVLNRHIHFFLDPSARFMLHTSQFGGYWFLSLQLETGVRYTI